MATRNGPARNKGHFGVLANGSSGGWYIEIDEYLEDGDRWCAQVEGPGVSFDFEIPSLQIIAKTAEFLGQSSAEPSLVIGGDRRTPITLIRDDEYNDRFFLVVGPDGGTVVRFVIAGPEVIHLVNALQQVLADINDD